MNQAEAVETCYRIPNIVAARALADEMVLLDLQSGTFFSLNHTGAEVWKRLAGGDTPQTIVEALVSEYLVAPDAARADVDALLRELEENSLVERL